MNYEATYHISEDELKRLAQGNNANEIQIEHLSYCDSCLENYLLILLLKDFLCNDN